ncbi:cyclodeaminase/cyclohydrolase family protein [Chakrabartyella piscis]|uniref:cyclodeaminase/cyclohydrolase family protein n=1 Tax=Chakrabartyella piscis TaxID=2918914 RepID=UPI0029583268|nr:cyclodeaminase/cyclohydrolase family protein [Chakrabartyella piscis]
MLNLSSKEFLEKLSSSAAVPGGGGAAALVGAQGVALGMMVGNLTTGKKKYADVEEDIQRMLQEFAVLLQEMQSFVQKDAEAFEPLSKAYGLPATTEEEKAHKAEVMEAGLRVACAVPMDLMAKGLLALELMEEMCQKGTRMAISDVGVGAECLKACVYGAAMNVYANTKFMKDRVYAVRCDSITDERKLVAKKMAESIYEAVEEDLRCQ